MVSELDRFLESAIDLIVQLVEEVHHLLLWSGWEDKLHVIDLTNDILLSGKGLLNVSHGDLLVSLGGLGDVIYVSCGSPIQSPRFPPI